LVFTFVNANADDATAVTVGGVPATAVGSGRAVDTAGEAGDCKAWFVGKDLPPGALSIVVTRNNNANVMYAVAIGIDADRDTEIKGTPSLISENDTLAEVAVDAGEVGHALRFAGVNSGLSAVPAAGASSTAVLGIDFGLRVIGVVRETNGGAGSRSVGFSSGTSDDRAAVHLAVGEVVEAAGLRHDRPQGRTPVPSDGVAPVVGRRRPAPIGRPGPGHVGLGVFNPRIEEGGSQGLSAQAALLEASATIGVSATAALTTELTMAGAASVVFTGAAALTTEQTLAATVTVALSGAGALTTEITVAAGAMVALSATAALTTEIPLAGAATVAITAAAELTTSTVTHEAGVEPSIGRRPPGPLGRVPSPVGMGFLTKNQIQKRGLDSAAQAALFEASATIAVSATATLTTEIAMATAVTVAITGAGALTTEITLAAGAMVALSATAALTTELPLVASATLAFASVGDLTVLSNDRQGGVSDARKSPPIGVPGPGRGGIVTLNPGRHWKIAATSIVNDTTLAAAAQITLSASAALTTEIRMAATASVTVSGTAALTTEIRMAGAVSVVITGAAALTTGSELSAATTIVVSGIGTLTTEIRLAGAATVVFGGIGSLGLGAEFAAAATVSVTTVGALDTAITLTGAAALTLTAGAALTTEIRFAGIAQLALGATGDLVLVAPGVPVVLDGKYRAEHRSAFADVTAAQGFAAEHASALRDVTEAGV
jgi:hypothetical protein